MIIVISHTELLPQEHDVVNSLFDAGMQLYHLRKYTIGGKEITAFLNRIDPEYHPRIALNSHHELASEFRMSRLHFSEQNRITKNEDYWKHMKDEGYTLSTSVHRLQDLEKLSSCFDYAFFGPLFDSISKPGYKAVSFDKMGLTKFKSGTRFIALGGISEENCHLPFEWNFDGIALSGSIWQANEPARKFEKINRKCGTIVL